MNRVLLLGLTASLALLTGCSSSSDDDTNGAGTGGATSGGTGGGGTGGTASGGAGTGGSGGLGTGGALAGTGGSTAGTGGGASLDFPTDTSDAGLTAFLEAESYKTSTWASAMTGPTEPPSGTFSPHGTEHIWYNQVLRQAIADGEPGEAVSAPGSMVVKEMFTGSTVVGRATMLRTDGTWLYFCTSTEAGRCNSGAPAGTMTKVQNCACHTGGILIATNIPPP